MARQNPESRERRASPRRQIQARSLRRRCLLRGAGPNRVVLGPNDLVLALVHRAANLALGVAGLSEVKAAGVENYDVSAVVSAHHKYRHATGAVMQLIGLEEVA
mmetsp:Transcript_37898/g.75997  ORF Transcript_37898/g.75997 Transcript_37898/m.75997 type:complete len:104 (-) Transcript_37898:848-1159(-)